MLTTNDMKVLRKIVCKTKTDRIKSKQIRESCDLHPVNGCVEIIIIIRRRRRKWDEHVTNMDTGRLVKISRDNIPPGRRSPGWPKRRWILIKTGGITFNKEEE